MNVNYPDWICGDCGSRQTRRADERYMTFHQPDKADPTDKCGWCGTQDKGLTQPRDYGYPYHRSQRRGVKDNAL